MSTTEIWTYQDMVEHLLDVFDDAAEGRPLRMAKRAAQEALRALMGAHAWKCYTGVRVFRTEPVYSTGTIVYDHSGGAYERLVTLSGGTFPANSRYYRIVIGGVSYPIDYVVDSTNILLSANENPGADVASTTYSMYRVGYPLPVGCVGIDALWCQTTQEEIDIVDADEIHENTLTIYETPADPVQASICNDGEYLNTLSLVFSPPPLYERVYSFPYARSPRQLLTYKYATGTVSVGAGTTTCTITTGAFSTSHIGSIIRFGTAASEPDGIVGGIGDTDNPFSSQRTIVAVASDGTSCTLDSVLPAAVTNVKFTVSDPVDIEHVAMLTAFQRLAEASFTVLTKREQKDRLERLRLAESAILDAKDADRRIDILSSPIDQCDYRTLIGDVDVMG